MRLQFNYKEENEHLFSWVKDHKITSYYVEKFNNVFYIDHELFDLNLKNKRIFFEVRTTKLKRLYRVVLCLLTLQMKVYRKRNVAVTFNAWSQNYFHWFTEVLPRVYEISKCKSEVLFVFPFPLNSQYQIPSLLASGVKFQSFNKRALFAGNLIFSQCTRKDTGHFSKGQFDYIKKYFEIPDINPSRNIYLKRSNVKRCVYNDGEVEMLLKLNGFEIIETDNMTLYDQINIFSQAKCLVSMHGAGLTNMIFMQRNQLIIEFGKEMEQFDKCYFNMCNLLGLRYFHLSCLAVNSDVSFSEVDLIVDLSELKKLLKSALS